MLERISKSPSKAEGLFYNYTLKVAPMFIEHEILVNSEEVLEVLHFYGFRNCIPTGEFIVSAMKALKKFREKEARAILIAADLLERYDVLETKKEGSTYRLYGHDAEGEKHLLLIKCD